MPVIRWRECSRGGGESQEKGWKRLKRRRRQKRRGRQGCRMGSVGTGRDPSAQTVDELGQFC